MLSGDCESVGHERGSADAPPQPERNPRPSRLVLAQGAALPPARCGTLIAADEITPPSESSSNEGAVLRPSDLSPLPSRGLRHRGWLPGRSWDRRTDQNPHQPPPERFISPAYRGAFIMATDTSTGGRACHTGTSNRPVGRCLTVASSARRSDAAPPEVDPFRGRRLRCCWRSSTSRSPTRTHAHADERDIRRALRGVGPQRRALWQLDHRHGRALPASAPRKAALGLGAALVGLSPVPPLVKRAKHVTSTPPPIKPVFARPLPAKASGTAQVHPSLARRRALDDLPAQHGVPLHPRLRPVDRPRPHRPRQDLPAPHYEPPNTSSPECQ